MNGSYASFCGGFGGVFPGDGYVGEKACPGLAVFGEDFVAAIAVITDGRCGDEDFWRRRYGRECLGEQCGALYAAVADARLLRCCPASGGDVFSREVYDDIYVGKARGIEGIRRWIPGDFIVVAGIAPGERQDAITARSQCGFECRADEARSTGYQDFHDGQLSG